MCNKLKVLISLLFRFFRVYPESKLSKTDTVHTACGPLDTPRTNGLCYVPCMELSFGQALQYFDTF